MLPALILSLFNLYFVSSCAASSSSSRPITTTTTSASTTTSLKASSTTSTSTSSTTTTTADKILALPDVRKNSETIEGFGWVFLGNYTSEHPQSVETIMLLLALQFLWGNRIILLKGPLELQTDGFERLLEQRFPKEHKELCRHFKRMFDRMPVNCRFLHKIYCTHSGLTDADIHPTQEFLYKHQDPPNSLYLDSINWIKMWSLPNVTVRDYDDNVETEAGYYYGEEIMRRIQLQTVIQVFFITISPDYGLGIFEDDDRSKLFAISSVKGLKGHGGLKTKLTAVAEVDVNDERITFIDILENNEMISFGEFTSTFNAFNRK